MIGKNFSLENKMHLYYEKKQKNDDFLKIKFPKNPKL